MRGGRRAQVTLFVLIGIAVLAVFIILLALRDRLTDNDDGTDGLTSLDTGAIEEYVESCIDQAWADSVHALAKQGGLLYRNAPDNGLHTKNSALTAEYINGPHVTVSYGLVPYGVSGRGRPWPVPPAPTPPDYPQAGYAFSQGAFILPSPLHDGPFGEFSLPPLCDSDGPNNAGEDNSDFDCDTAVLERGYVVNGPSVQESLAASIAHKLAYGCFQDVTPLEDQLGVEITPIDPDDVNVTVLLTRDETIIDLRLPIRPADSQSNIQLQRFSRAYPVRLHDLFQFVTQLLKQESSNPFFNISKASDYQDPVLVPAFDGFTISTVAIDAADTADHIAGLTLVDVNDFLSSVEGSSLHFEFLLPNRAPILDYIPDLDLSNTDTFTMQAVDPDSNQDIDIALMRSGTDYISMKTKSPDPTGNFTIFRITVDKTQMIADGLDGETFNLVLSDEFGAQDSQAVTINLLS